MTDKLASKRSRSAKVQQRHDRERCPECGVVMSALAGRSGGNWKAPYLDPADGARLYNCAQHGRVAVYPDGRRVPEATT